MCYIWPLLIGLVFAGVFLFGMFAYPIWMIIDCALAEWRSKKSKIIWLIVIVLVWPFGSWIYGLAQGKKNTLKAISTLLILGFLAISVSAFILLQDSFKTAKANIKSILSHVQKIDVSQISSNDAEKIRVSLSVLDGEAEFNLSTFIKKDAIERVQKAAYLIGSFQNIIRDNQITPAEFSSWIREFESRQRWDVSSKRVCPYESKPAR